MIQMRPHTWSIQGMDCPSRARRISLALEGIPGVAQVQVTVLSRRLSLRLDPDRIATDEIEEVVRRLGHDIARLGEISIEDPALGMPEPVIEQPVIEGPSRLRPWRQDGRLSLVLCSFLLFTLATIVDLQWPALHVPAFVLACLLPAIPAGRRAWSALRLGQPFTMESLTVLAVIGGIAIGAAQEAALVVMLFCIGDLCESSVSARARRDIRALAALLPGRVTIMADGVPHEIEPARLLPGHMMMVDAGQRLAADGIVMEGSATLDESALTGERALQPRDVGREVMAGSLVLEGSIQVLVTRTGAENTVARIMAMIEDAEISRANADRIIDRFCRWYMPLIVLLAAIVAVVPPLATGTDWGAWAYRGLALLLVGCPCALMISAPVAMSAGLSVGARHGLLLKGGVALEATAAITRVAFDKGGVIMSGQPRVLQVIPAANVAPERLMALASGMMPVGDLPVSHAILRHAAETGVVPAQVTDMRQRPGLGVELEVDDQIVCIGTPAWAQSEGLMTGIARQKVCRLEEQGLSVTVVFTEGALLGMIATGEQIRPDSEAAIRDLSRMGIDSIILTAESSRTAAALASRVGACFRAGLLPQDKLAVIADMAASGPVMMVGDCRVDPLALRQADVGVVIGTGMGLGRACGKADAAILRDAVGDVPAMIRLARATMGSIRQNIALALGLKAVVLVTTLTGLTGLWPAITADTVATVLVGLNAMRLLRLDPLVRPMAEA